MVQLALFFFFFVKCLMHKLCFCRLSSVQIEQVQDILPPLPEDLLSSPFSDTVAQEAAITGDDAKKIEPEPVVVVVNDLLVAIQQGELQKVQSLYAQGYEFDRARLKTPLLMACLSSLAGKNDASARSEMFDVILEHEKNYLDDIDLEWFGQTALHMACHIG